MTTCSISHMIFFMKQLKKILLISDSNQIVGKIRDYLSEINEVTATRSLQECENSLSKEQFELILVDFFVLNDFNEDYQGADFYANKLTFLKQLFGETRILIISDSNTLEHAGHLIATGFDNIIQVPFTKEILVHRITVEEQRRLLKEVAKETGITTVSKQSAFHTENTGLRQDLEKLEQVALSRSTVLISGESGTGKSLIAKHIHKLSNRKDGQFVEVHCGAIAEGLVESELFGHEKGSFTGAIKRKIGKFELAQGGTIFLDEIGTVSKTVQIRLLQVLQERFIQRVGGEVDIPLDIRIIAATNTDLKDLVDKGDFREDLYYRLNVFHLHLPSLRDRKEDLKHLSENILEKLNKYYSKGIKNISTEVLSIFYGYNWPGNIRELENILERAYVLESSHEITAGNIPTELIPEAKEAASISPLSNQKIGLSEARKAASDAFEKKYITELLIAHNGKIKSMANEAGVSERQIHKLMSKHSIRSKDFDIQVKAES